MSSLETIYWIVLAVLVLVGLPLTLVWTAVSYFRGRGSERQGTGGITAGIAAAMQELDRITTRPAVEHKLETENRVQKREDDSGGD